MKKMNQTLAAALLALHGRLHKQPEKEAATTETTATEAAAAADDTTALSMTGTFEGIFPTASCEGIRASLTINADSTYTYKKRIHRRKNGKYESSGIYHLKAKDLIELITPSSGEKTLFQTCRNRLYAV